MANNSCKVDLGCFILALTTEGVDISRLGGRDAIIFCFAFFRREVLSKILVSVLPYDVTWVPPRPMDGGITRDALPVVLRMNGRVPLAPPDGLTRENPTGVRISRRMVGRLRLILFLTCVRKTTERIPRRRRWGRAKLRLGERGTSLSPPVSRTRLGRLRVLPLPHTRIRAPIVGQERWPGTSATRTPQAIRQEGCDQGVASCEGLVAK